MFNWLVGVAVLGVLVHFKLWPVFGFVVCYLLAVSLTTES
jgi:hypothetical protein